MASSSGSRTGLITAVVVLSIVSATALVFTFIFSAEARRSTLALDDMTKRFNEVIRSSNLSGPTVVQLRERRNAGEPFSASDSLLDVAVRERDDLARLVGGQNAVTAMASAKGSLAEANEKLKVAGLTQVSTTEDMAGTIKTLSNAVATLAGQVTRLTADANNAKSQAAAAIANTTKQLADKDKQIADARTAADKALADAAKDRADKQGTIDEVNKAVEAQNKAHADAMQALSVRLTDAERGQTRVGKDLTGAMQKLSAFRPDEGRQSTVRQADGIVDRVANNNTVYINLGAGNQIVPGMTFEVYDKLAGVPALKADDTSIPQGKASLEVIRVDPNSSLARVVRTSPGLAITEGDVVANLVYDRNTRYNFVIYGKFDLTKPGTPAAEDAAVLRRLVREWGGNLQDNISVSTDFLVLGAEPTIPVFNEEQRRDPLNAKILSDAQADLDAYYATRNKAQELYIPILNQNRFLYYVGYFAQARR